MKCKVCGKEFEKKGRGSAHKKTCSPECSKVWHLESDKKYHNNKYHKKKKNG